MCTYGALDVDCSSECCQPEEQLPQASQWTRRPNGLLGTWAPVLPGVLEKSGEITKAASEIS